MPFTKGHTLWKHPNSIKTQFKKGTSVRVGMKHSPESILKMSESRKGKAMGAANGSYKHGATPFLIKLKRLTEYKTWQIDVFKRDDYTCRDCGHRGGDLTAHHLTAFAFLVRILSVRTIEDARNCIGLWNIRNGLTLCIPCHKKTPNFSWRANILPRDKTLYAVLGLFFVLFLLPSISEAATFGYTTSGASFSTIVDTIRGSAAIMPENGTAISMTIRIAGTGSTMEIKTKLYDDSNNSVTNGETTEVTNAPGSVNNLTLTFPVSPTLTANTTYKLAAWSNSGVSGTKTLAFDATGNADFQQGLTYGTWPEPLVPVTQNTRHTIWVTYTVPSRTINAANYTYCRTITSNNNGYTNGIATTTAGLFPLIATSTISTLAATSSGGNVQLVATSSARFTDQPIDIVFTDEATCSFNTSIAAIPHYFEKYASTTGAFTVHLGTSNISSTTAKTLAMYYGNAGATNLNSPGQTYATTSPTKIVSAWDLSVPGFATTTMPDFTDSTYNNNHGSSRMTNTADFVTAQVDGGLQLNNDQSQNVSAGTGATLDNPKTTVSFWAKVNTDADSNYWFREPAAGGTDSWNLKFAAASDRLSFIRDWSTSDGNWVSSNSSILVGKWYHIVLIYDEGSTSNVPIFYINGVYGGLGVALNPSGTVVSDAGHNSVIGLQGQNADIIIDDVQVYSQLLTQADIQTIYNTTSKSDVFWTFGNEETQTPPATPSGTPGSSPIFFDFDAFLYPFKRLSMLL